MDSGFTYAGRHNSELGTAFIVTKWPGSASVTINDATIPGRDGTIRYPGQTYDTKTFEGTLYILDPDDETMGYTRMMERVDEITAWLQPGGQRQLILDAVSGRFYIAEIVHAIDFTTREWENGSTELVFTLQPFAYNNQDTVLPYALAANVAQSKVLALPGNRPAPIKARFAATAALTWVQLAIGNRMIRLAGMTIHSGDVILIDADVALSEITTVSINGSLAREYVTEASAFPLEAYPGNNLVIASANGACAVTVSARGRWK